jgi:hypothetical protein
MSRGPMSLILLLVCPIRLRDEEKELDVSIPTDAFELAFCVVLESE